MSQRWRRKTDRQQLICIFRAKRVEDCNYRRWKSTMTMSKRKLFPDDFEEVDWWGKTRNWKEYWKKRVMFCYPFPFWFNIKTSSNPTGFFHSFLIILFERLTDTIMGVWSAENVTDERMQHDLFLSFLPLLVSFEGPFPFQVLASPRRTVISFLHSVHFNHLMYTICWYSAYCKYL